jgi:hypothetical protein
MRRIVPIVAAALLGSAVTIAAIALPAGADEGTGKTRARPSAAQVQQFRDCLRSEGVQVPNRRLGGHRFGMPPSSAQREAFREAADACAERLGIQRPSFEQRQRMRERVQGMRRCLRQERADI